jgi:DNA-binding IclR family transcriptional regulator
MWELASRASPTLSLRDAAMPYLEDVHSVVGHHAQLGVLDGDDVLFIERLTARDAVINYSRIAGRLPLHISSSGHVLLAHGPPDLVQRVPARPLRRYTANTLTTPDALLVPVRNALNEVVAALAVIVPNDGRGQGHVPVLLAAAHGVRPALSKPRAPA